MKMDGFHHKKRNMKPHDTKVSQNTINKTGGLTCDRSHMQLFDRRRLM